MKIRRPRLQDGFTLVELLIVVVILGVLAAIAIPQFSSSTDDSKLAALDSTLNNLRTAVELYYQQHGSYPSAVTGGGTYAVNTEATFVAQLASYTSAAGVVSTTKDATYKFGPYLKKSTMPADPINNIATVEIVTTGTLGMTATGSTGGWKFDNKTGQLIVNITAHQAR